MGQDQKAGSMFLRRIIVDLENLSSTVPFILDWTGMTRVYGKFPDKFPTKNKAASKDRERYKRLFEQLSRQQNDDLKDYFQNDFAIGGYKWYI